MGLEQRRLKEHDAAQKHPRSSPTPQPLNFTQIRAWRVRRNRSIRLAALYVLIVIVGAFAGDAIDLNLPLGNYFSDKRNFFNRFFVKFGWAWTSLAFASCAYIGSRLPPLDYTGPRARSDRRSSATGPVIGDDTARFARYAVATGYWYAMTQWCWGPPLIDRLFAATGGTCSFPSLTYSIECKSAGGQWEGGHDASGHCMMLIHATLFLWEEVVAGGFVPFGKNTTDKDGKDLGGVGLGAKIRAKGGSPGYMASSFAVALGILWTWMLLTTALFFHPLEEKISGTIFGILGWAGAYLIVYPYFEFPGMPIRE